MSALKIARGFSLPVDVAGEAIATLAKRGAGKTNTARVLVEELAGANVQVVVLDPVGAWWGLRAGADGKRAGGLEIPVLGGAHGDVPLQAAAGALLADVVVDAGQSLVLDLSDFSKTEQRRFVAEFAERLYQRKARNASLLHVVLEEADEFAPQRVNAGDARMVGAIEQLVRRGRGRGLGLTMITQRSASLNKSILTQADVLIALRTTGPQDRKAIEAWIEKQDVDDIDVVATLPSLQTGEAWIWNPERDLLQRVQIRLARTFDSSSTPKAGQRRTDPTLAAIDLAKLGAEIEATAERARESDPTALRKRLRDVERDADQRLARIRELEHALEQRPAEVEVERVEVPVLNGNLDRLVEAVEALQQLAPQLVTAGEAIAAGATEISTAIASTAEASTRASTHPAAAAQAPPRAPRAQAPPQREQAAPARPAPQRTPGIASDISGPQQRILDALAALETIGLGDAHKTQLALFAQASPKSSSYSNNLGALRTAGYIDYPAGSRVALTPEGRAIADASGAPTSTDELHTFVYGLVGGAKARLLEALIAQYPNDLAKDELAERAGASATSSSFSNNLGSLRSLGLIDYPAPGRVAALPVLFLEGA
jgi:uncharacterized protein